MFAKINPLYQFSHFQKKYQTFCVSLSNLVHAVHSGFTQRAIIQACMDLQLSSASHSLITPINLIHFAMIKWNQQILDEYSKNQDFDNFKTNHKIKKLIKERLELQAPYINRWNEAMAIGAYPSNCSETSSILWQYSDDCWYLSGDRSNDMNFYTKRSLFLYCYMSTELFMLTDKSSQFNKTWEFLDRRFQDVYLAGSQAQFLQNLSKTIFTGGYYMATMFLNVPSSSNSISKMKNDNQ